MHDVQGKKIYVGLSGGVDSAVSAALLQGQGAQVTGVFIKGWYPPEMPCTWAEDRRDAMRVAAHLRIPFITLDASREYKQSVIDYLLREYAAGRTPNPDVFCNRDIKFGVFYHYALAHGADAIATGHYRSGEKDQSYFLWAVPREVLARTLFPIGHLTKSEVRELAKRYGLPVALKKDSQGICFLGSVSVEEFLARELGSHNPAVLHTIGQRVEGGYVTAKDVASGVLTIAESPRMYGPRVAFNSANWQSSATTVTAAQVRYRSTYIAGHIEDDQFVADSVFSEPVAPGQSIVFYNGTTLVGGGIITGEASVTEMV